jgi:transposase-like protein
MQEMSERESRARSTVRTIDVSDEQCISCPVCKGTDIELVDESAGSFLCNLEEWVCRECRRCFLVETKRFITYEEVGGHGQGSPGTASHGQG